MVFFKAVHNTHIFEKTIWDKREVSTLLVKCAETQEANGSRQSGVMEAIIYVNHNCIKCNFLDFTELFYPLLNHIFSE